MQKIIKGEPYKTILSQVKYFCQQIIKYLEKHTVTEIAIRFRVSRKNYD